MKWFLKVQMAHPAVLRWWTWGGKLEVNLFLMCELLEDVRAFIVEALEVGEETRLCEEGMRGLVGSNDRLFFSVFDGNSMDAIRVTIVENE